MGEVGRAETGRLKAEGGTSDSVSSSSLQVSGLSPQPSPDEIWALRDVSFEVKHGEVLGIIGKNGAGKSTLLKILSRITDPTSGRAMLRGRVGSLLEVGTGFHPELTGRENVFLNGSILGMKRSEIRSRFDEIVDFSGVETFIDTPVKRYSSGMMVRLAFSVAAHLDPEILLVDEVLAVGDVAFQSKCLGKMKDVVGEGRSVLFVSHNLGAVRNLCTRAILIENGGLALDDSAEATVVRYLGKNLILGPVASAEELEERMEGHVKRSNPFLRFVEVALLNSEGVHRKTFFSDESITVSVSFRCFQMIRDPRVVVKIVDEMGQPILASENVDDVDIVATYPQLSPGLYNATCTIPANTFGGRSLFLSVDIFFPKTEHLVVQKILEFDVRFKGYNNIQYTTLANTFVRPRLKWTMGALTE